MWSNLNNSFTAITQTISESVNNFGAAESERLIGLDDRNRLRHLETQLDLARQETKRYKRIAKRVEKKSNDEKQTIGDSEIYEDIDLSLIQTSTASVVRDVDEENEKEDEDNDEDLELSCAANKIIELEDELAKVCADNRHWRALATQKTQNEDELDKSRQLIQSLSSDLQQLTQQFEHKLQENDELRHELDELDTQHELALGKVLELKNDAHSAAERMRLELDRLQTRFECLETDNEELRRLTTTSAVDKVVDQLTSGGDQESDQLTKRGEPEGNELPDRELVSALDSGQQQLQSEESEAVLLLSTQLEQLAKENIQLSDELVVERESRVVDAREMQSLEARLKSVGDERDRLLNRQKELESLHLEMHSLKTAINETKLSSDQLQRDYDQLLLRNRYLEEEFQRHKKSGSSGSGADQLQSSAALEEALAKMSLVVRDKDQEVIELKKYCSELKSDLERESRRRSEDESIEEMARLTHELSRLRQHLLEVEDNYTAELVVGGAREEALARELAQTQSELEELKNRRKEQKLEEQLRSLLTEREMARNECSQLEDKVQQYSASVANLQLVIEQIQRENERKLTFAANQHKTEVEAERRRTEEAMRRLRAHEQRFAETAEALGAASRLSESIDLKEQTIDKMKQDVAKRDSLIESLRKEMAALEMSAEGKVDKQVIKSLIIGYFVAPADKRHEVERLLARFLDFNQQEMERSHIQIGRKRTPSGIDAIFGTSADSLSQKFVEFLESESKPTSGQSLTTSSAAKDITRDLSKQLISQTSQHQMSSQSLPQRRSNPFLASMAVPTNQFGSQSAIGSRQSSANSSTDNLNQLFIAPTVAPNLQFTPVLVSTPTPSLSTQTTEHSPNSDSKHILKSVLNFE